MVVLIAVGFQFYSSYMIDYKINFLKYFEDYDSQRGDSSGLSGQALTDFEDLTTNMFNEWFMMAKLALSLACCNLVFIAGFAIQEFSEY
jgi:hypothetical protein